MGTCFVCKGATQQQPRILAYKKINFLAANVSPALHVINILCHNLALNALNISPIIKFASI
jgi:hypothetical protein